LVRWIVDLNFGMDVAAPVLTREFRIEESPLTMPDVSLMIQSGYTPRKEWIERHFRVELEQKKPGQEEQQEGTTFDPQKDQDLFGSIFGDEMGGTQGGTPAAPGQEQAATAPESGQTEAPVDETAAPTSPTPEQEQAAAADLQAAADETAMPAGAAPEESQADAVGEPSPEEEIDAILGNSPEAAAGMDPELADLWDNEPEESVYGSEPQKPFGDQTITEDEAVEMDRK